MDMYKSMPVNVPDDFTYLRGSSTARFTAQGNAKALKSGVSELVRHHAFFIV